MTRKRQSCPVPGCEHYPAARRRRIDPWRIIGFEVLLFQVVVGLAVIVATVALATS